jgi:hypothetical protein
MNFFDFIVLSIFNTQTIVICFFFKLILFSLISNTYINMKNVVLHFQDFLNNKTILVTFSTEN